MKKRKSNGVCIVRSSEKIREMVVKRFGQSNHTYQTLIDHAEKNGIILDKSCISRYMNSKEEAGAIPTQEGILDMCDCLGIIVRLKLKYQKLKA